MGGNGAETELSQSQKIANFMGQATRTLGEMGGKSFVFAVVVDNPASDMIYNYIGPHVEVQGMLTNLKIVVDEQTRLHAFGDPRAEKFAEQKSEELRESARRRD